MLQGFTSPPVRLNLDDLMLKRAVGPGTAVPNGGSHVPPPSAVETAFGNDAAQAAAAATDEEAAIATGEAAAEVTAVLDRDEAGGAERAAASAGASAARSGEAATGQRQKASSALSGKRGSNTGAEKQLGRGQVGLAKKYGPGFVWGQLNGWYKQTVFDPTASLSAERRGTISLPDVESCYGGSRSRYTLKVRTIACLH